MSLKVPIWVYFNRTLTVSLNGSIWVPFEGFGERQEADKMQPATEATSCDFTLGLKANIGTIISDLQVDLNDIN